jgi:epoxyqueuosine reductase
MSIEDEIRAHARQLGLHRVGIARAEELTPEHERYLAFVAQGFHGAMAYLAENPAARRRVDTDAILADARSVVVCALAYHRGEEARDRAAAADGLGGGTATGPRGATIARYARGRDYHNFFRRKLRKLAAWLRRRVPGTEARPVVDTAPVLERAWAQRAGVGFVGKNGCVIAPGLGSYVLLGEVVTTLELAPDAPLESRCGSCTRCLDACPTEAFVAPFVLDPRRCVSYLTIEQAGAIPVALRPGVADRLFGCDACQEVCPYNATAPPPAESTASFAPDPRWATLDVADVARLDEASFAALTAGSPLSRPGRAGLARNAVVVMGNSRDASHLPALRAIASSDPDETVRDAARWAIDAITDAARDGR